MDPQKPSKMAPCDNAGTFDHYSSHTQMTCFEPRTTSATEKGMVGWIEDELNNLRNTEK